ncbi:MAG: hypothetical protein IPP71_20665 [Bacteroidetes bacterium]|nr:hypothetical protein [Bacteroidota bacterium]
MFYFTCSSCIAGCNCIPGLWNHQYHNNHTTTPGAYKNITLTGNKTITLNGPGIYIFNTVYNSGSCNTFKYNFQNNPTGTFKLYFHGNMSLGKCSAIMINGGSANRIYTETHGNGVSCGNGKQSFVIDNGSSSNSPSKWLGTVYAPYAAIRIGSGTGNSTITGAFWSGTQIDIQCNVAIVHAPFSFCSTPNANAGADKVITCANTSVQLSGASTTSGVTFSWLASNGGNISSGATTATPTVTSAGTYTLTVTSGTCTATDVTVVTSNSTSPGAEAGNTNALTCSILELTLNGSSPTGGVNYSWTTSGTGNIVSGGTTATPVINGIGTYTSQLPIL